jgi:predicted porin
MEVEEMTKKMAVAIMVLIVALFSEVAAAQSGFYVYGAVGNTDSEITLGGLNRVADDNSSYAVGAGYAFNRNISLEGAYLNFGSHFGETDCPPGFTCLVVPVSAGADLTGISLSLIGSLELTARLDVYGKVGIVSWDIDFTGISSAFNASGEDLLYGAGLRWSIDDHWKVFAEYGKVELDLNTASIGVRYHF